MTGTSYGRLCGGGSVGNVGLRDRGRALVVGSEHEGLDSHRPEAVRSRGRRGLNYPPQTSHTVAGLVRGVGLRLDPAAVLRVVREEQAFRALRDGKLYTQDRVMAAEPVPTQAHDFSAHEQARAKAEAIYKRAVAKLVAQAEASALAARLQDEDERKRRRAHDAEAALLLLLLAGVAAYRAAYKSLAASPQGALGLQSAPLPQLGAENTPTGLQTPANEPLEPEPDAEVDRQAEEFAQERAELLRDVPNKVRDALDAELAKPDAAAESLRELSERLGKVAQKIEDGYGRMVVNTETHTAYGHAALRVLAWRGYDTKLWQAVGDERTCPTCMSCEDRGPLPLGDEFVPGVVAPPAHNSCRCWLVGGSKAQS